MMLAQPDRSFYFAHPQVPQLALRKLMQQPPVPGAMNFQGPLQTRTLSELVHLLQQAGLTGRVTVWTTLERGDIWVQLGRIVHAEVAGRQGHVAALTMFGWPRGNFLFQTGRPPTQSIQLGPHYLLSDAARRGLLAEQREARRAEELAAKAVDGAAPSAVTPVPDVVRVAVLVSEASDGSATSPSLAIRALASVADTSMSRPPVTVPAQSGAPAPANPRPSSPASTEAPSPSAATLAASAVVPSPSAAPLAASIVALPIAVVPASVVSPPLSAAASLSATPPLPLSAVPALASGQAAARLNPELPPPPITLTPAPSSAETPPPQSADTPQQQQQQPSIEPAPSSSPSADTPLPSPPPPSTETPPQQIVEPPSELPLASSPIDLAAASAETQAPQSALLAAEVLAAEWHIHLEPVDAPVEPPGLDNPSQPSWAPQAAIEVQDTPQQEDTMAVTASSVKEALSKLEMTCEGFIGAAVADSDSGMCIGSTGGAGIMNLEVAAAANTEVVRAKRKAMKTLGLRDEIEDILITLGKQYHLVRPLRSRPHIFIYLAVDRGRANLAMARYSLADVERDLGV